MKNIRVGDYVEFKSDVEQGGRVLSILCEWLTLGNNDGFIGEYIGGDMTTRIHISDVFEVHAHTAKKKTPVVNPAIPKAPKKGVCKQVWDIASAFPMLNRSEIIEICQEKGINKSTASTQYSKWKKATK